jgi:Spy/CpxP family protein refolding chaperone
VNKTIIALALAAIIPTAVLAATDGGAGYHRGPNVERLAERLDLSAEQQEQVRALFEAHKAERQAMREKMRASMAEVLTPDQQAKMETMREMRRAKRKERRERRGKRHHGKGCGSAGSMGQS